MSKAQPVLIELQPGAYYWCRCGKTKNPGFCDGSHKGSDKEPLEFSVKEKNKVAICACGRTKTPPYCDGTHLKNNQKGYGLSTVPQDSVLSGEFPR